MATEPMFVPRGPLYRDDKAGPDVPDRYRQAIREWKETVKAEALAFRNRNKELKNVGRIIKFLSGDHWDQFGVRPSYKSKAMINKVALMRLNHLALLTDARPAISVSCPTQFNDIAEMLKALLEHEWQSQNMELELMRAVDASAVYGTSFWKITGYAPGVMRIRTYTPETVIPIRPSSDLQSAIGLVHAQRVDLQRMLMRYRSIPEIYEQLKTMRELGGEEYGDSDGPGIGIDEGLWGMLDPTLRSIVAESGGQMMPKGTVSDISAVRSGGVERLEIYIDDTSINESGRPVLVKAPYLTLDEHNWWYWVNPGERLYPRKRLVIFVGDTVVYDGPNPYWDGLYPFACLRLNPVFWSFWGLSKYRDLIEINRAMNEVLAGILDMIKRVLNPVTVARGASIPYATWQQFVPDMPGAKLYLPHMMANPAADIQFLTPNPLPPYVFQMLVQFLGPEFEKMAGIIDINRISGKMQVPGGDTLEQMRDALQTPLRREYRMVEAFLRDAGTIAISRIFQFYSKEQKLQKVGQIGVTRWDFTGDLRNGIPEGEAERDFWRQFTINVEPGSMHGGSRDRRKLMMISLYKMGAISRERLLRELEVDDVPDPEFVQQQQMMAMAREAATQQGAPLRMTRGQRNGEPV